MIQIRNATPTDLSAILDVEKSWHEQGRAGADKFLSRLKKFPEGFFVALETGRMVATITAMPLFYSATALDRFSNWDDVTAAGYLKEVQLSECNALYIVSGVIDSTYRGQNIFAPMVLREVELAQSLGLRYVLAGAVLPGFKKFCTQHGESDAHDYSTRRRGKHLIDPLLALYEAIGFAVPDANHVIPEYYPDDASRNFAAMVVRDLLRNPLISSQSG